MPRRGGYVQDQWKKLVDQRQRELQAQNHEKSLNGFRYQGCVVEFETDTKRKALVGQAKQAVSAIFDHSSRDLISRQRRLQNLLAEEQQILLEEHQLYMGQQRDMELDVLRQKAAAIKSEKDAEKNKLAYKKRVQQYKENSQEARILEFEHNKLKVKQAQELQRELKREAEEKRAKELEEHAISFRETVQNELREQAEQNLKSRCELFQQTRAFLNRQLEEKRLAEHKELEARKAEELILAEKYMEELRLEKQKARDEVIKKREIVAGYLKQQMTEKEYALRRQKEDEIQQAKAEKNLIEKFAENQQKEMRSNLISTRQAKDESKTKFEDVQRFRNEQSRQLDMLVQAEQQRLLAKEKLELERREQARQRLSEDVLRQLQEQTAEREKLMQSEKEARENEARQTAEMVAKIKKQEEDEKRIAMLTKLKYREDLKKQMDYAKQIKDKIDFDEKERAKKAALEQEDFLRRAKEEILRTQNSQHPFALHD